MPCYASKYIHLGARKEGTRDEVSLITQNSPGDKSYHKETWGAATTPGHALNCCETRPELISKLDMFTPACLSCFASSQRGKKMHELRPHHLLLLLFLCPGSKQGTVSAHRTCRCGLIIDRCLGKGQQ